MLKRSLRAGDAITVRETGGHGADGELRQVEDDPLMEPGVTYLLSLWEEDGRYHASAGPERRFVVERGAVIALSEYYSSERTHDTGISDVQLADVAATVPKYPHVVEFVPEAPTP